MGWRIAVVNPSSTEDPAQGYALDLASANPARDRVALELTLGIAGSARVEVLAVDGRRVALLHDGPLTAHVGHRMVLDGSALAPGVYVVRATSGAWSAERRVTLAR
jgi:hypothetical protein